MNNYDWKIHKKLEDARTVYIVPARANGKTYTAKKEYLRLLKAGKKLVFMSPKTSGDLRGSSYESIIVDRDMLSPAQLERAERILDIFMETT